MNRTPAGFRSIATALSVTLTLALAAGAGCQENERSIPTVREKMEKTHINGQSKLTIGIGISQPLLSEQRNGVYSGFDVEIARYIAESLGYRVNGAFDGVDDAVTLVQLGTEKRIEALQSGDVDFVVAAFSMTEEREKDVSFAGPYLVTTQEVLIPVRLRDRIRTIDDLSGEGVRVCASGGSTSQQELIRLGIKPATRATVRECVDGILNNQYDVVSSDETILAGFRYQHPGQFEIVDMPFGATELLGVGVPKTDPHLRDLIAFFLHKSYLASRRGEANPWQAAYNATLGNYVKPGRKQPPPQNVPELVDFDDKTRSQ
ncbi:transporter substrate-binding domain-containing protein [Micromonospora sp. CPCC 206060]|uniref:transporter substrate-binding domain-containing protein n=1 Tax=Micromonospora sp. CPCC 206060 TaxID=3122406 RepID=UPI002FF36A4B